MMKRITVFLAFFSLLLGIIIINSCKKDVVIPTLTTASVTDITINSATAGGSITKDGGATVTARGVCWGTTANPVISGSHTSDNSGTGSFTSNLTNLAPNTQYHLRAYATNKAGTAYGADVTFATTAIVISTLTTTAVTGITLTTAASGGNITADGGGAVTARGVCWATTANPVIGATNTTTDGTGTGVFTSAITGLLPGTPYHIRAYATNSAGTAYGADVPFTTLSVAVPTVTTTAVTGMTLTTAASGGNVIADGGAAVTVRGVCWATTVNPVIGATNTTSNGTGTGVFTSNLTGLLPGTPYHVRAYATNSAGTAYGADVPFSTTAVGLPTLTTDAVTGLTLTTAISGGNITADGGGAVTARGVCWATTASPIIGATNTTTDGTGTGVFVSNITGLLPGTPYHVRAYATNSAGTAYGADVPFTTNPVVVPTLTTTAVTGVTLTTAATGGNITDDGGGAVTARGICWATTLNPVIGATNTTTNGTGTGVFVSNITGLLPGTPYHVRAYATNSAGTAYGADFPFTTTAAVAPTLTTVAITALGATSAVSGGVITSDGGSAVTVSGICWGTTALPVIGALNTTTDGLLTGTFPSTMTGLTDGTTYYVRAYATNAIGTSYGNQLTLLTKVADNDGNTYNTVKIGNQVWMAQNLATTKYNDNSSIPNLTLAAAWIAENGTAGHNGAYCWYNNDGTTYKPLYGAIYNWYAVNTGNLCPTGWHVPSDEEYQTLELFLGMAPGTNPGQVGAWEDRGTDQGTQMKNTTGWSTGLPNLNGTNTSGFSALPGGYRFGVDGSFQSLGQVSYWWASDQVDATTAFYRRLDGTLTTVYRMGVLKSAGKYIRCIK
jgi:uncharacterized protein (TIGR02145 family)